MTLDIDEVMEMYLKAKREKAEEMLWQRWLVDFSRMNHENFISFENYKKEVFKSKTESLDKAKILEDAEDIKRMDQKGGI